MVIRQTNPAKGNRLAAYLIVTLKFHSLDWAKSYLENVPDMVRKFGGEYLARSKRTVRIEGEGRCLIRS